MEVLFFLAFSQYFLFIILSERMQRNKQRPNDQLKTLKSQQSCIDVFSKIQSLFLEKFYRYNLSDYFQDAFASFQDEMIKRRIKNKQLRQLASETFLTNTPVNLHEFVQKMNIFYNMEQGEILQSFKYLYGNAPFDIGEKELVMVQVRMRAEIEKVENLPSYFYAYLEQCQSQLQDVQDKQEQQMIRQLCSSNSKVLNLFVIYFGDINFTLFRRDNYGVKTVTLFSNQLEVRIYVFYISRLAMIEKFKKLNKIKHLRYIEDLHIRQYESKRDKAKTRRVKTKNRNQNSENNQSNAANPLPLKWVALVSLTGLTFGALYFGFYRFFL